MERGRCDADGFIDIPKEVYATISMLFSAFRRFGQEGLGKVKSDDLISVCEGKDRNLSNRHDTQSVVSESTRAQNKAWRKSGAFESPARLKHPYLA